MPIAQSPPPALPALPSGLLTYLNTTLAPLEQTWQANGHAGPSTTEAARLVVSCLEGAQKSDVHADECQTEFEWLSQCMECERKEFPAWMIVVISAIAGIAIALSAVFLVARARRHGARTEVVHKGQPVHKVKAEPVEGVKESKIAHIADIEHTPVQPIQPGEC